MKIGTRRLMKFWTRFAGLQNLGAAAPFAHGPKGAAHL